MKNWPRTGKVGVKKQLGGGPLVEVMENNWGMSVASHYDYVQCFPVDFVDAHGKFLSQNIWGKVSV